MRRPAFVLFLFGLVALVCAPDIACRFMDIDAPWLGWVQALLMAAGVIVIARPRLKDIGHPESRLWQALLVVTPVYALFASPLAGLLPVPSQLSSLALVGANGIICTGLAFLALTPSERPVPASPGQKANAQTASDAYPVIPVAKDDTPDPDSTPPDTSANDTSGSDASGGDSGGGDGGGGD